MDDNGQIVRGRFYEEAMEHLPDLAKLLPDGKDRGFWGQLWGKIRMAGTFLCTGAVYRAEPLFQGLFGKNKKIGDVVTPLSATFLVVDEDQTVTFCNFDPDNFEYLKPERMRHDLFVERKDIEMWKLAAYSSKIPFVFSLRKSSRLMPKPRNQCGEDAPMDACNINTIYGIIAVDGAVSASFGSMAAANPENRIIVTVAEVEDAKPLNYTSGSRKSGWWMFGPVYSLYMSSMHMLSDDGVDRLMMAKMMGTQELGCKSSSIRKKMEEEGIAKELGLKELPDGTQFSSYTKPVTNAVFNYQYDRVRKMLQSGEHQFTLEEYARRGMILCVSSGGAYAVDELAAICALCDEVDEHYNGRASGIINLITGTSAGSLNALYISQIHDKVYNLNGENSDEA